MKVKKKKRERILNRSFSYQDTSGGVLSQQVVLYRILVFEFCMYMLHFMCV